MLGILSDKIARIRVITLGQVVSLVGMAALLFAPLNEATFFAAIACVAFNFGGTITVFPSLVSEFFGLNNGEKLRRDLLRLWHRQHLRLVNCLAVRRILCHLLRNIRPVDYFTGPVDDDSAAAARSV